MLIKTPQFWIKKNFISYALLPFSLLYFLVVKIVNCNSKNYRISKPVICVGNFIAGGSGKTPVAIALGKLLNEIIEQNQNKNFKFVYLSRGYKNAGLKFSEVCAKQHDAKNVGDEPLILSEIATTFVAKNRLFGAKEIEKMQEIKAIILDDGMQNDSLKKDFTIAVVDGNIGFGNGFLIPAGPMRQTFKMGYKKADCVVIIGEAKPEIIAKLADKKIIYADLEAKNLANFLNQKLIAFCGLAYPNKFFSFLEKQNCNIVKKVSFPDHYDYKNVDLEGLIATAQKSQAQLVTTKKDWIKFPPEFKSKISYLDVELKFVDEKFVISELKKLIGL